MPIWPQKGPCLACVFPEPPSGDHETCETAGILASTTASVASLQVSLALRIIVGWDDFECRIHSMDIWDGASQRVSAGRRDPECPVCVGRKFRYLEGQRRTPVSLCGRNAVQLHENSRPLNLQELAQRLRPLGEVRVNEFALRLALPKYDFTVFPDGRAIVRGTTDVGLARSVYAQLIGS